MGPVRAPLGPLAERPHDVSRADAVAMLLAELEGLPMDTADRALLLRAEGHWDPADVVILASLFARARLEGPAPEPVTPSGQAAGWAVVCVPCGVRPVQGPAALAEAEATSRAHDLERHSGAWVAEVVLVDAAGRPASGPMPADGAL